MVMIYLRAVRARGPLGTAKSLARPQTLFRHLKRIILGDSGPSQNFYVPSLDRDLEADFCRSLSGLPAEQVVQAFGELDSDQAFVTDLRARYRLFRGDHAPPLSLGRLANWYVLVRLINPAVVLETGVHDGLSSALILRAMSRNQKGRLISIDLPHPDLPPGADGPGWLVAGELRSRWKLHLGDARKLLPELGFRNAPIDLFIHDSDHSREFQQFEYQTIIPFLARPGFLLSDDAQADLIDELGKQNQVPAYIAEGADANLGIKIGGIRLEREG